MRKYQGEAHLALQEGNSALLEAARLNLRRKYRKWLGWDLADPVAEANHTIHRSKALQWCVNTDRLLADFCHQGWQYFSQPSDLARRSADPTSWPLLRMSIDQGSDGHSAVFFLSYGLGCNIDYQHDVVNHGLHNDLKLSIKSVGKLVEDKMFCSAFNLAHGPYDTGARLEQSLDALEEPYCGAWRQVVGVY